MLSKVTPRSLQIRLAVMLLLAFAPALILYWHANRELRSLQVAAHELDLERYAQTTAVEHRRLVEDSRSLLGALAEFPEIRSQASPACSERLFDVLQHTPQYTTISVIGVDGYMTCGALPVEGSLYLGDRAYFLHAGSSGRFSVGEYALGRITGKPGVGVALPLAEDGDGRSVLAASIDLTALGKQAAGIDLPRGTSLTVLDRTGRVLVRVPRGTEPTRPDTVGAMAPEEFPAMPADPDPEIVRGRDFGGSATVFAVAALATAKDDARGYVAVGRPDSLVTAELRRVVSGELTFLAVAGLVLVILSWVLGHVSIVRHAGRPGGGSPS